MTILTKYLREYLESETLRSYPKDTQNSYNNKIRQRVGPGLADLTLIAEKEDRIAYKRASIQSGIFDKRNLERFVRAVLKPKKKGFNDYINDVQAYQRAIALLRAVNGALNEILESQKIQNMKLMPNSNITRQYYPNIAALEMMLWAYPDMKEKKE